MGVCRRGVVLWVVAAMLGAWTMGNAAGQEVKDEAGSASDAQLTLGVLLYPGFELLDVFGPVEMFMYVPPERLRIVMIAEEAGPVASSAVIRPEGPKVIADYGMDDAPKLDILLVPGGTGTLPELQNERLLTWIRERSGDARIVSSVCTGSALLAKAGVLEGRKATTNKAYFQIAAGQESDTEWLGEARWVEDGNTMTSSGVSAGIDMSLALIARLFGEDLAEQIAEGTEYVWSKDPSNDPFARLIE